MTSLDIFCPNPLNFSNKSTTKIKLGKKYNKIFCGPSKIFKKVHGLSRQTCLKCFMAPAKKHLKHLPMHKP